MCKKDTDKTLETLNDQVLDEVQGGGGMARYVFRCPICNKCFTSKSSLQYHQQKVH